MIRMREAFRKVFFILIISFFVVVLTFPFVWMAMTSFKPTHDIISPELKVLFAPTLEHYLYIFTRQPFLNFALNSIIVAVTVTLVTILCGTLAAYSISRFDFGGKPFRSWIIFTRMLPPPVILIPLFVIFRTLGLLNTLTALVMADITFLLSFIIWIMRSFFDEIPYELEEAGLIDGCSRYQILTYITIPLASPGIVSASILTFIFAWNEYLFAMVFAPATRVKTLPVAAADFITGYATNWGPVFAASTMIVLPAFLVVVFLQKYIIRGLTLGAFK